MLVVVLLVSSVALGSVVFWLRRQDLLELSFAMVLETTGLRVRMFCLDLGEPGDAHRHTPHTQYHTERDQKGGVSPRRQVTNRRLTY